MVDQTKDPGNRGSFDAVKSQVIQTISNAPKTVDELSEELKVTTGFASAVLFHIENHERFDFYINGSGKNRTFSII